MIYIICGPTGSGKTECASFLAHKFNAPIINADAFQIYKGMDIGTAKISKTDPDWSRYYLLDIVEPNQCFNVKEYQTLFRKTVSELSKKYQDIIVVGGTGLYIKASIFDYDFPNEDNQVKTKYDCLSNEELFSMLVSLDKESSLKIHKNNRKRVIRALEIAESSNFNKSENIAKQEHKPIYPSLSVLFINPNRDLLYKTIDERVDKMFEDGLINEVESLIQNKDLSLTSFQGIGYKEVCDYLDGKYSLEECKKLIKKRTRNYAKRQVTFFKNQFKTRQFLSKDELFEEFK